MPSNFMHVKFRNETEINSSFIWQKKIYEIMDFRLSIVGGKNTRIIMD